MFLISKLFALLLKPLTWAIVIFMIALLTRNIRRKKRLFIVSFCILMVFSNPFLFRLLANEYEQKPVVLSPNDKFKVGIVLGGFVSYNVRDNAAYFNSASDRFIETALLYKTGHIEKIIVSAGNGYVVKNNFQEASFVKDHLVQLGIPAEDIFTDGLSRNTYQNAEFTKKICDSLHLPGPYLLISSALHLPRAQRLFEKQNMDVRTYPCDFLTQNISNNFWEDYMLPSAFTLYEWDLFLKELTGLLAYRIVGKA